MQKHTKIVDVKSIVVPIDLTKESLQIVSLAGDLAKMFNAEVHVIAEKQSDQILNTRIQNRIGLVKKQYEETEVKAQINMVKKRGSYGKKVTEYFKKNNNDIVAIAYHSESLFPQFDSFAKGIAFVETDETEGLVGTVPCRSMGRNHPFDWTKM